MLLCLCHIDPIIYPFLGYACNIMSLFGITCITCILESVWFFLFCSFLFSYVVISKLEAWLRRFVNVYNINELRFICAFIHSDVFKWKKNLQSCHKSTTIQSKTEHLQIINIVDTFFFVSWGHLISNNTKKTVSINNLYSRYRTFT